MMLLGNQTFAVAFVALALVLTFLMYYLWKFPYDKERHVSDAPRSLVTLHRVLGYVFVAIYVYLMADMVPRLWTYQVELPARTVAHLLLGMAIGAILIVKLTIVRFFKHMEATLVPMLGTALLVCTVLLLGLALPTTFREAFLREQALTGGSMGEELFTRVRDQLPKAGITDAATIDALATEERLYDGRGVLVSKCVQCHDLRTILVRPRTPETWRRTVERMANRATVLDPISEKEQLEVTAYLIAISPTLQRSTYLQRQETMRGAETMRAIDDMMASDKGAMAPGADFDLAAATMTFESRCSQCHSPVLVQANPPASREAAATLVARMVRNGLQASDDELAQIVAYLVATFVGEQAKAATPAAPPDASADASRDATAREIVLRPDGTLLSFETPDVRVRAGSRLRVVLDNPSASGLTHNFVLVREADAYDEVSNAALAAAASGFAPSHDQVLAAIPAVPAGSRGTVELAAPAPGRYRFGCMMPGHGFTMRGTLVVEE